MIRLLIGYLLPAIFILTTFSSCFIDVDDDGSFFGRCVEGNGSVVSQEIDLDNFEGIHLKIFAEVYIKQGPTQKVVAESHQNIIDLIERDVRNRVWEIETSRCTRDIARLKLFITLPNIDQLSISGSGDIISENILVAGQMDISLSGSGNIDAGVDVEDLYTRVSGSGDVFLEGTAGFHEINISGSGDISSFKLLTDKTDVQISGSGDADVHAAGSLKVKISGSGDVRYKGNPSLDVQISGSGSVVDAN